MTLSVNQIKDLVGNRWFDAVFIKKDGTIRKMNCRIKVGKYVLGTGKISPNVVGVWDRAKFRENLQAGMKRWDAGHAAYRCFLPNTVVMIRVGHKNFDASGKELTDEQAKKVLAEAQGF